jgi:hypothetical protein
MTIVELRRDAALVRLTSEELIILNNSLNEVVNALDLSEFSTRMGVSMEEVRQLLAAINGLLQAQEKGAS